MIHLKVLGLSQFSFLTLLPVDLYVHRPLDLLLHLFSHYDPNYFPQSWSFPTNPSRRYLFPSHWGTTFLDFLTYIFLQLLHCKSSILSLLQTFRFVNGLQLSRLLFSLHAHYFCYCFIFFVFFVVMPTRPSPVLIPLYYFNVLFCVNLFLYTASITFSLHHHVSPLPLQPLSPHISYIHGIMRLLYKVRRLTLPLCLLLLLCLVLCVSVAVCCRNIAIQQLLMTATFLIL